MANPAPEIRRISPEALKALLDGMKPVTIVDVRAAADYFSSPLTILGALTIAPDRFAQASREIPRSAPIVLFDGGPTDDSAPRCAAILQRHGYANVAVLDGGWNGWIGRDYPTVPREP